MRAIDAPVVITGAGPVGLLLACELRRAGAEVVVLERLASPMTESRAAQLTTLTAELLHERGFDDLLGEAVPESRAHFGGLPFHLAGLDSDHAGSWKVPQYRTEAALGRRAAELGVPLLRSCELTGVAQAADRVVCTARGPDGEIRIRARYLVGCDGAGSTVRRLCGFTSSGTAATKELLRADVSGVQIRDRRFERLLAGFAVAGTHDGVTRVMAHAYGQGVTGRTAPPDLSEVGRLWEKVTGEDISGGEARWTDAFDNARGQADGYRRGRVLLAGDAAHWHLPIGGQSLNIGVQDAVNLGWKLAGVLSGWAPERLLDSYQDERHPVAARMLSYVAAQETLLIGDREIEPLRAVLAELIALDQVRGHLARVVSGLDDHYAAGGSAPVGRRVVRARLRDRNGAAVAPIGPEPVVVRLSTTADDKPTALPCGLEIPTIHAVSENPTVLAGADVLIVRPDGYIAWAGRDDGALGPALEQWLGAAPAGA